MIQVESDVGEEWDSRIDWGALAEEAIFSAVISSEHKGLADSPIGMEISVKFTSDDEVRALNAAYRGKDRSTNVLSFPMIDPQLLESVKEMSGGGILLGDVVLAHGVCAREAEGKGVGIETHASHLLVHGTLHLLGYDHERGEDEAEAMEGLECAALAAIGIADPYTVTEVQS